MGATLWCIDTSAGTLLDQIEKRFSEDWSVDVLELIDVQAHPLNLEMEVGTALDTPILDFPCKILLKV